MIPNPLSTVFNPTSTFEAGYYAGIQHHQNTQQQLMYAASRMTSDRAAAFATGSTDSSHYPNYAYPSQTSGNTVHRQQFYQY